MYSFALFILTLMANLTCVEDLFSQGTCDWICEADSNIDKETTEMMSQGKLVKFKVFYEEQVDWECANQTEVSNSSSLASLWLKTAADDKPRKNNRGRMQFVAQSILEGIFTGHFVFGGYKEINVSCILKSTSKKKSATKHLSRRRLTFHTPQSTLYYIEQLTDYTKSNTTFLTLLRNESHTRLSAGFTGATGSLVASESAKDSELLISNGWLFLAVIIWIVFLLYSPAIFTLFRPAEATLQIVRKARKTVGGSGPSNIQPVEQRDEMPPPDLIHESGRPTERENVESRELLPHEGEHLFFGSQADVPEGSDIETQPFILKETKKPTDEDSKMVPGSPRRFENRKIHSREKHDSTGDHDDLPQDLEVTNDSPGLDSGFARNWRRVSPATISAPDGPTCRDKSSATDSAVTNRNDEDSSDSMRDHEELNASDRTDEELSALSNIKSRNNGEQSGSDRNNGAEFSGRHVTLIDIPEEVAPQSRSVQSSDHEEEQTDYIRLVIVEDMYPVGFGSFIGNKLFSTMNDNKNKLLNMVKLFFIFFVPILYFTGLVDLFLALLPNLHSRMGDHLPFPFLTYSVVNAAMTTHPSVLFLIVLSFICYFIRLSFVCFLSRSTLESAWNPCSVHRLHPVCLTYRLLQSFLSEFPLPKSFCTFNRHCGHHLSCILCYRFYKNCSSLKPCADCKKPVPQDCSKYLDLPENILHNLKKHPDIFIKYWDSFFKCLSKLGETKNIACCLIQVMFSPLGIVPLIMDIIFSSPLFCLCYGRLWMLNERYKSTFKGSKFILPIIEFLLIFFSLVWVIFFLLSSAVPLGVGTVGLIKVLSTHSGKVLPHLTITVIATFFVWSCYRSFTAPYRILAKQLASSYQKKFDELDKKPEMKNMLVPYKLGEQGNHVKVIPKELFNEGCKEFKLRIKNKIAVLFLKLLFILLVVSFIFPIVGSDNAEPIATSAVISCLALALKTITDAIIGEEFEVSQEDTEKVVENYIKK